MTVYVLPKLYADIFEYLAKKIKIKKDIDLLKKGFTNYYEPEYFFSRAIKYNDNYDVSFCISVSKKTTKVKEVSIIDENFGQPHFCDKIAFDQIVGYLKDLIKKEAIEEIDWKDIEKRKIKQFGQ